MRIILKDMFHAYIKAVINSSAVEGHLQFFRFVRWGCCFFFFLAYYIGIWWN